jgi:hypothetical protein
LYDPSQAQPVANVSGTATHSKVGPDRPSSKNAPPPRTSIQTTTSSWSPERWSDQCPTATRLASPIRLPIATSSPASASAIPVDTAEVTVYVPRLAAAALPRANATAASSRAERATSPRSARERTGAGPAGVRGTEKNATTVSTAAATYAQRQPTVRAIDGTASPDRSAAMGIDECFMPKASPCRPGVTWRETRTLEAVLVSAVPVPHRSM